MSDTNHVKASVIAKQIQNFKKSFFLLQLLGIYNVHMQQLNIA